MTLVRSGLVASLLAASLAPASESVGRAVKGRPPVAISAETGLVFRLSEGAEAPVAAGEPASATPLDADATRRVLDRLPPLAPLPDDQQPFAFRERSLPPPRTGATVLQQFPPPAAPSGGAPEVPAGEPVTVLRRSPEGAVPIASHLSVTFSQPMVPVGAHDDLAAKGVPVQITPQPPGHWRWVGTRTLLFEPAGRFPMATAYRVLVPAGAVPAAGAPSRAPVEWRFTTPAPTITVKHPLDAPARRDTLMFVAFDQRIDAQAVLGHVQLIAGQGARPVRLATAAEVEADEAVRRMAAQAGDGRWMALRAVDPLPPDTGVTVTVGAGTPSAEGPITTAAAQSWGFRTFGPLRVVRHRCGWQEGRCPPGAPWQIELSNPIDAEAFDAGMVRVEPALPGMTVAAHGPSLVVQGQAKPRVTYRVTLAAALPDVFGQSLGADQALTFAVGPAEPTLSATGGEMVVLDPAAGPRFSVYSAGMATLAVSVHRVAPADWPAFKAFQERAQRDRALPVAPGTRVWSRTIPVAGSADALAETAIDLRDALPGGLGHAIVVVTPGGRAPDPDRWPGRVIAWVQATRIGLDAFVDADHLVAWATALDDGRPLAGVDLELVPAGPRARSGADGLATFGLDKTATALVARLGNDVAFLPARMGWWDKSGWERAERSDALRWMVFDDRGLYRPGEDVKVKGWVRLVGYGPSGDVEAAPAAVQSIAYALKDAQGNQVAKGMASVGALGGFDLTLALPPTMNLGNAFLELSTPVPGLRATAHGHAIQVQEFRRPEFEVTASASEGPHFVGGEATATVRAAYFAGGVLPDAAVTWNVRSKPGQFTPPGRDDFVFGTWVPWWRPWGTEVASRTQSFESRTDATGQHHLKIAFDRADPPQASQVEAEASVMDVNRQAWTSTARLLVHPADVYVGLRAPRLFVQAGERLFVEGIVVDLDGRVVTGRPVQATAERLEWKQVKGEWKEVPADREECPFTSTAEPTRCGFKPDAGGSYRVTATVTDAKGRPNQTRLQLWVAGGAVPPRRDVAQEEVTLVPAKKEYRAGDTAEILVLAPFADAEGLLTLRRSGLVRTERFRIQGSSHTLRIPIEDAFVPNVHVQVDLVGAAARTTDAGAVDARLPKRPAFAQGTIDLAVPPVRRTLAVSVAARDAALEPGGRTDLAIEVKDAQGRPVSGAELAVVVVDEAVLALSAYKIPDPLDVFYAKRDAEVADRHLRAQVQLGRPVAVPGMTETLELDAMAPQSRARGGVIGGLLSGAPPAAPPPMLGKSAAMEGKPEAAAPIALRADFRALALFAPAVRTDASGRATVEVTVPESLTRYRITAVAVAGPRDFGKGESTLTARLPLMVRPSAPRFLNFGDRFELPVVVQNQTAQPLTVDVAVRASNATLTAGAGRRVTVPAGDRVEVRFPVAAESAGTARFQVGAASGRWADAAEVVLPVWTPATTEAFATYGQIDAGAMRQPIETPRDVVRQFGGLEVTTSSTALSALTDAVLYLTAYPFECAEQVSSRVLAVAALKDVLTAFQAKGLPAPAEMAAAVDRDVKLLARLQNDDGGFAFWRRGDPSWPYISIHVAHALQRAKDKGFPVPAQTLDRARDYLVNVERHIPSQYGPAVRRTLVAYALHVRSRMGDRDPARARGLLREAGVDKLSFEALGWILPLLAGDPQSQAETAQILRHLTNRVTETAAAAHFAVSYGDQEYLILHSDRRADAIVLEALIAAQPKSDLIPKIVTGLLAHRRGGRWENTQENTFVLLALDRYFAAYESVTPDFTARLWLGERYAGEHAFRGRTTERHQVEVPMAQMGEPGSTSDLILSKEGKGRLYYRVGLRYAPASLKLAAADHGFTVERVYEAIDDPGDVRRDASGTWRIRAGARVRVSLTMVAPARRYHVALVDPLPAGLEAQNPALATTGALPPAPADEGPAKSWWWWSRPWFEHQNLRDERVEAFTTLLWEGVHRYSYVARATTPGRFVVPPPKAEEMYHPETFGRGATDTVTVE